MGFFTKPKFLLIINDNGLGDYFLVRNYFKYIKKSDKYKKHKIIFLSKPDRIDCVKCFDKRIIDKIILFEPQKFISNTDYQKNY